MARCGAPNPQNGRQIPVTTAPVRQVAINIPRKRQQAKKANKKEKKSTQDLLCMLLWLFPPVTIIRLLLILNKAVSIIEIIKFLFVFLIGFLLSLWYLLASLEVSLIKSCLVAGGISFSFTSLLKISKIARCIAALCIPESTTFFGRFVIGSIVTWLIIQYPLANAVNNGEILGKSVVCYGSIASAQGQILKDEMLFYQREMSEQLLRNINAIGESVTDIFDTIDSQIEIWGNAIKDATEGIDSIKEKCMEQVDSALSTCISETNKAYEDCKTKFPPKVQFVCEPVQLGTKTCEGLNSLSICSVLKPTIELGKGFESVRQQVKHWANELEKEFKLDLASYGNATHSQNLEEELDQSRAILNEQIHSWVQKLKEWLGVIHYFLFFIALVLIPFQSTMFFIKQRAADRDQENVNEKLWFKNDTKGTKAALIIATKLFLVLCKCIFVVFVLFVDCVIFQLGNEINEHLNTELFFNGTIDYQVKMSSTGFVSSIFKSIVPSIDVQSSYNVTLNTNDCKPEVENSVSFTIYVFLLILLCLLVVMTILSYWATQFRTKIYRYFFPLSE